MRYLVLGPVSQKFWFVCGKENMALGSNADWSSNILVTVCVFTVGWGSLRNTGYSFMGSYKFHTLISM